MSLPGIDLEEEVRAAQAGDREALVRVIAATQRDLRIFVACRAPNAELVDEVVQATYVALLESLPRYASSGADGSFRAWLRGIARNRLRMELRERGRGGLHVIDEILTVASPLDAAEGAVPAPGLGRLEHCLSLLTPRLRSLLERRYRDGLPYAELARQFKQNAAALARAVQRAAASMRDCLGRNGGAA